MTGHGMTTVTRPENPDDLLGLARFVEGHTEPGLLLGPDEERVPLPAEVYRGLRQVVKVMRQGKATVVASSGPSPHHPGGC